MNGRAWLHLALSTPLWLAVGQIAFAAAAGTATPPGGVFVDVTRESGVAVALARHYERHPKWWLSGVNLVDLDSNRQVKVYRNDLPAQNWVRVRLVGRSGNRGAAGAKIRLTGRDDPNKLVAFEQVMILDSQSAHSYHSLAPTERHFGLGRRAAVDVSVEFYPSGKRVVRPATANSVVTVAEGE